MALKAPPVEKALRDENRRGGEGLDSGAATERSPFQENWRSLRRQAPKAPGPPNAPMLSLVASRWTSYPYLHHTCFHICGVTSQVLSRGRVCRSPAV